MRPRLGRLLVVKLISRRYANVVNGQHISIGDCVVVPIQFPEKHQTVLMNSIFAEIIHLLSFARNRPEQNVRGRYRVFFLFYHHLRRVAEIGFSAEEILTEKKNLFSLRPKPISYNFMSSRISVGNWTRSSSIAWKIDEKLRFDILGGWTRRRRRRWRQRKSFKVNKMLLARQIDWIIVHLQSSCFATTTLTGDDRRGRESERRSTTTRETRMGFKWTEWKIKWRFKSHKTWFPSLRELFFFASFGLLLFCSSFFSGTMMSKTWVRIKKEKKHTHDGQKRKSEIGHLCKCYLSGWWGKLGISTQTESVAILNLKLLMNHSSKRSKSRKIFQLVTELSQLTRLCVYFALIVD